MALPVPVWGCSGRSRRGAPPSRPNQPDDGDRDGVPVAPTDAADSRFRPRTNFAARSPSGRGRGDGRRPDRAPRAMTDHSAVGSDPAAARTRRAGRTGTCRTDSTSAGAPVDGPRWLSASSAESSDTRSAGARLGFGNTGTPVDSCRTGSEGLGWLGRWGAPNGENKSSARTTRAPTAARCANAATDADSAAANSWARTGAVGSAPPPC
jgi:hypothetical protein